MMATVFIVCLLGALGAGLVGGVFFAFSAFVMRALARLPAPHGIAAMQSINVAVLSVLFLGAFVGVALISAVAIALAALRWHTHGSAWLAAGGMLYLVGAFLVTVRCNVPLNERLARMDPASSEGEAAWARYRRVWTAWNHVRTLASIGASASFTLALAA